MQISLKRAGVSRCGRLLFVLLAILLFPAGASASECMGFWTRTLFDGHQAVFTGEVLSITADGAVAEIRFRVKRSFKFDLPRRTPVVLTQWATSNTTDFSHRFEVGNDYLVFTSDNRKGSGWPAPRGYTSRFCDAWETNTLEAKRRISELEVLLRNREFGRGISR